MEKIKIAYCISTFRNTGPVRVLYNLVKNLDFEKYDCYIITFSSEPENTLLENFVNLPVKIIQLNLSRLEGIFHLRKKIVQILNKEKINIIHSHGLRADILNSGLKSYVQTITTIHNFPYEDYVFKYGKIVGNIAAKLHLYSIKKINFKVACSVSLEKKLHVRTDVRNLKCIQNGIEMISQKQSNLDRNKLNLNENDFVIIYTGSLNYVKNPLALIRAFSNVEIEDIKLLILGHGPLKQKIIELSKPDERIHFMGYQQNVFDYLLLSNAYISPSFSEGLPMAVLEGMSINLIPILSNIPQHKEVLPKQELEHLFFNPNSEEEMAKSINFAYELAKEKKNIDVKNIIESNFTANIMSNKYQLLYEKLIES